MAVVVTEVAVVVVVVVVVVFRDARAPPVASGPAGGLVDDGGFEVFLVEAIMSNNEKMRMTKIK